MHPIKSIKFLTLFFVAFVLFIYWIMRSSHSLNNEINFMDSNTINIEKTESIEIKSIANFNDPFANKMGLPMQSNNYDFQQGQRSMKAGGNNINIDPFKDVLNNNSAKSQISPFGATNETK